jgi:hypothetical protein
MSSLGSPNPFFIAGKKAYEVERSLRFNDDDTAYLSRTPSSAGDRKKWTFSAWIKRSNLGGSAGEQRIFGGNTNASHIYFPSNDEITWDLANEGSGSSSGNLNTTQVFRDSSAWFHLVCALDTDESTADNRMRMYVNGTEVTSFGSRTNPSSGYATNAMNNNTLHTLGYRTSGQGSAGMEFDGYMAEINFIDGQQYDASYFGETNVLTGQWIPKKYTGSYGTNGFYLNFSDNSGTTATTLGKDSSGNGNNFTPNNFSVSAGAGNDSLEDSPTNNFCTMNPLVPSPTATWANGNLDLGGSSSTQYNQNNTSTFGVTSGKWYAEVKFTLGGTTNAYMGICPINAVANANMTGSVTDAAVIRMDNTLFIEGSAPSAGTSISSGDIIGIALDMDNQKVWFSVQGTYVLSGNPSTGANATFDGITAGETIAICARPLNNTLNFNFGQRPFAYTPPTGFKKLNSANLPDPTILLPNKHFDTLLYTGNATSRSITGLNFQPDWVWIKNRSNAYHHGLFDAVRGANKVLKSSDTSAEGTFTQQLMSFNSDGYTLGDNSDSGNYVNINGHTYVGWNWNAGDTDGKTYTVTVVDDSGNKFRFDGFGTSAVTLDLAEGGTYIFNYPSGHPFRFSTTADGTHGGGSEYTTGVTHNSSTQVTIVVAASAPTLYYYCSSHSGMGGQVNTNTTLGSSNFDGSNQTTVKVNATAGFSIVTYTGTGSTTTFGHGLGVAPQVVITKPRSATGNWGVLHTVGDPTAENRLHLNDNGGYSSYQGYKLWNDTVPTSSVFTVREDASTNASSVTYVAYVFSEVAGYSKFGKYTGNASTNGTFSFCGFKPAFVLLKKTNNSDNWTIFDNKRDIDNSMHRRLRANLSDAEATNLSSSADQIDFLSNGFKMRTTSNNHNGNNSSNIFLAFAESPFKNARAR